MIEPLEEPVFCDRCSAELKPGSGGFYVVRIEAISDPFPTVFSQEDMDRDLKFEIEHLMKDLRNLTRQEASDEVYRRIVIYLCNSCYGGWIENPAS